MTTNDTNMSEEKRTVYDAIREGIADDFRKAREHSSLLETIAKQKDVLEVARKTILAAHKMECIHDKKYESYCDFCPCSALGADDGEDRPTYEQSKILCPLDRSYSQ